MLVFLPANRMKTIHLKINIRFPDLSEAYDFPATQRAAVSLFPMLCFFTCFLVGLDRVGAFSNNNQEVGPFIFSFHKLGLERRL